MFLCVILVLVLFMDYTKINDKHMAYILGNLLLILGNLLHILGNLLLILGNLLLTLGNLWIILGSLSLIVGNLWLLLVSLWLILGILWLILGSLLLILGSLLLIMDRSWLILDFILGCFFNLPGWAYSGKIFVYFGCFLVILIVFSLSILIGCGISWKGFELFWKVFSSFLPSAQGFLMVVWFATLNKLLFLETKFRYGIRSSLF